MAQKRIFSTVGQFSANVGSAGLDFASMPLKLQQTVVLETIDDFNDGILDPKWLKKQLPSLFLTVAPNSAPNAHGWFNAQNHRAQTFKLTSAKPVIRLGIRISATPAGLAPGSVTVEIQETSGPPGAEVPSGVVVAQSAPKAANTLVGFVSFPPPVFFTDFDLLTTANLQAGVTYALVVKLDAVNTSAATVYLWGENNDALNYPNGRALNFNPTTQQWQETGSGFIDDYDFRLYEGVPNPEPVETGGFLQFDFPSPTDPKNLQVVYNQDRTHLEFETRLIFTVLNAGVSTGHTPRDWGIHILQGTIKSSLSDADKESRLLVEVLIRPYPPFNNLAFVPLIVDANGSKLVFHAGAWQGGFGEPYPQQFVLPDGSGAGTPVTLQVLPKANGGVIVKAFKNDDPNQVVFQTPASPPLRQLSGPVILEVGHSENIRGSRIRFDYIKFGGPILEPETAHVILRHDLQTTSKVTGFTMDRTLPAPGSKINVLVRAGNTLAELAAAQFGGPLATTVAGNIESGGFNLPASRLYETKLEFIRGSPGPTLNSFDFTSVVAAVSEDQPLILSLDELDAKDTPVTSEESSAPTANTLRMADGDPETQWVSLGNAQDGQQVQVIILLGPLGTLEPKPINTVILRNTNIKSLQVFIGNSLAFDGEIDSPDEIFIGPTETTAAITIIARSTNPANQNKKIGEVYIGRFLLALPGFDSYEPRSKVFEAGTLRTLGGRLVSFAGVSKYAARWRTTLLSSVDKDVLDKAFRDNRQITLWPEPASRPREIFDVGWTMEELPHPFTDVVKGAGHSVEAEVEEV